MLRKLKGRSLTELRVRGGQAAACLAERSGVSPQARLPTDAAFLRLFDPALYGKGAGASAAGLLEHFRARPTANFFAAFDAPAETRALLRSRFGGRAGEALVERAERIVANRFSLLGLHDLDFGDPIDWQLEPVSGKRSPLEHWSRIDYLDAAVAGDKKITWELNRQQYFQVLGRAYWHTGDERYAETFARHLTQWTEANPPKLGINWASSLEVAFRAISWLWSLHFFKDSPHLSPALYLRALKFLHAHARHLETYLSTYFSPNTHLTGEALGLFYLGTQLPEMRAAARWRETGASILLRQLERHVRPDGVYFEQSSYYHRYTTDFYIHFLLLLKRSSAARETLLEEKLTALLDHLMHLTLPDGTTPLFGDDDGGRLAWLDERPADDFRATLATGASLFKRADYKFVAHAPTEETLWLAGARGLRDFDELAACAPAAASRAFPDGGYYVMRDGWTAESNCLLIDCGPHGSLNGAHAHADALSLVAAAAHGRTLLVDSGTYTYTGSPARRDEFRATNAHNTLTVDGESSSVAESAFRWRGAARAACRAWLSQPRFDLFEGEHDGYLRLSAPATHARGVLFLKGDYWIVRDRVESDGAHDYALHFHFAPHANPEIENKQETTFVREGEGDTVGLMLFTFAREGAWHRHDELVSNCYASAVRAPVCTFAFSGKREEVITLLMPRAARAGQVTAREIEAVGGRAFELTDGERRDCLLLRACDAPSVETARFASSFDWTWLRFRGDDGEPQELIAIDGRTLRLDGREVISAAAHVGYLAARREGSEWRVESDAGENVFVAQHGAEGLFDGGARPDAPPPHDDEQRGEGLLVSSGE
ncbi:MAG TPA: alginate lyase family protein [Pyrinomonadaceae bacterium]|nr:alginate lyase family protein [Pyrinomonadaceae bacterium]